MQQLQKPTLCCSKAGSYKWIFFQIKTQTVLSKFVSIVTMLHGLEVIISPQVNTQREGQREGERESHLVSVRFTKLLQAIMTGQRLQTVVKSDCYSCVKTVLRRTKPEVKWDMDLKKTLWTSTVSKYIIWSVKFLS